MKLIPNGIGIRSLNNNANEISPMKLKLMTYASLLSLAVITGCSHEQVNTASTNNAQIEKVNADNIKAHLAFLADDTLQGRDTGSQGYQIAANYVKSYFKQLGLKPMGEHESFEQEVTFRKALLTEDSAQIEIETAKS